MRNTGMVQKEQETRKGWLCELTSAVIDDGWENFSIVWPGIFSVTH